MNHPNDLPALRRPLPVTGYPSLAQLVRAWTETTPAAPAVCQANRTWTYAELFQTAAVLTDRLTPGQVVAVTGPQSFGLVSALLATLWSGAVLLPIDPALPPARRQLLLEQAGARCLVRAVDPAARRSEPDEILAWGTQIEIDAASGRALNVREHPGRDAAAKLPAGAAYIFFTSGTTGRPKAVLGTQCGLSHFLVWQRDRFGVGAGDRVAQLTNLGFDVLMRSVFLALVSGGTLCLPPASLDRTGPAVLDWLVAERITLVHVVPSLAQAWLAGTAAPPATTGSLRASFFAGEPLSDALVRRWRQRFPASLVVNLYGPTETTMAKFCYVVPDEPSPGIQPVGWPLPATEAHLGEADEILIRTPYRTLGYLNAPAEQQQRFVPNPARHDPEDCLYRSGDRGRFREDGALEVLGRLDHQVKIQGVRIEPDEIGATINALPQVQASVVLAQAPPGRDPVLVAYVVARELTEAQLRAALAQRLPAAMIPARVQFLARLPVTANGKVDRAALAALAPVEPVFVVPRTALEQTLASLWQQVLGCERVGLEDNFFELGGNSLRLAQVHRQLSERVRRELPIATLFQYPTIRALAGYLSQPEPQPVAAVAQRAARIRGAYT